MNVFISYDHRDKEKSSKLENDLMSQNIGIWIDKKCIKPGNIWLKEIDEGLSQKQVDYVLAIVTENYIESTGMIEAYAKISEGLGGKDIKLIPLFFEEIKKTNSVLLKAIQGIKFLDYDKGLLELIKFLKSEVHEDPTELLSKIEGVSSKNPFRRTRAEYFEDDFSLLAKAFADPEKERYELVRSRTPLFIFGGRGSGKTMLLKSLTPEVLISRFQVKTFKEVKQKGIDYFGIYLRLVRGSFSLADNNTILKLGFLNVNLPVDPNSYKILWKQINKNIFDSDPVISSGTNAALIIFLHEINFKILKTILIKLKQLQQLKVIEMDIETEQKIALLINKNLNSALSISTFNDLIGFLECELDKIKDYLQKIAMPYSGVPSSNWIKTSHDFIDQICKIFIDNISDLQETKIYLLLDEFENLHSYQQKIINEWVKTSNNLVVKIGAKFEGMHTIMTLQGQPLQFKVGECDEITLDYDFLVDTDIKQYQSLLKKICSNLLTFEGYKEENRDIGKILENPSEPEIPQTTIDEYIKQIKGDVFQEDKMGEYRNKLEVATIFRLLREREKVKGRKSRKKIYAGFDTYTYLSSGIIRIFLNLVGMAFYRAEGQGTNVKNGERISVECQSWAAHVVSKGYLEKIHKNIESYIGISGEMIYQFVTDIGDVFRERLLFHSSEPETLSISIKDPQILNKDKFLLLNNFLNHSVRESILYKREETSSYRPKQTTSIRTKDYILNRIYTPALEISYRTRWGRCYFTVKELSDLLDPDNRGKIKKDLQQRQKTDEITYPLFKEMNLE